MNDLKKNLKNYLLVKYAENKLTKKSNQLSTDIPWIKRQHLSNTIESHCWTLLNALINQSSGLSFRQNKFLVDNILKYSLGKGENWLQANRQVKSIKPFMQLNSFVIYNEIIKGISENKTKKTIMFNIEKQLSEIQEKIDSKMDAEELLKEKISA